jgi:hypothetical protein
MEIKRRGSQPSGKGPAEYSTGTVRIDPRFEAPEPARRLGVSVTFEPCTRSAWHTQGQSRSHGDCCVEHMPDRPHWPPARKSRPVRRSRGATCRPRARSKSIEVRSTMESSGISLVDSALSVCERQVPRQSCGTEYGSANACSSFPPRPC